MAEKAAARLSVPGHTNDEGRLTARCAQPPPVAGCAQNNRRANGGSQQAQHHRVTAQVKGSAGRSRGISATPVGDKENRRESLQSVQSVDEKENRSGMLTSAQEDCVIQRLRSRCDYLERALEAANAEKEMMKELGSSSSSLQARVA